MAVFLEGQNISYSQGFLPLFSNLFFILKEGETLAIRGTNGAGKSTLLRLLIGLTHPLPKTLFWKGKELEPYNLSSYQQNLLYVGHRFALHPEALIRDQIHLWHKLYKVSENAIEEALKIWGVLEFKEKKIARLSQGQQKRLSLSRCHWLHRPLWVFDEPQVALDKQGKAILCEALSYHTEKGGCGIIATHEALSTNREIFLS